MYIYSEQSSPKEIIESVEQHIASILITHNFKFFKSKKIFIKKVDKFIFKIWIQSNRYNQSGLLAEAVFHCSVSSNDNKQTRKTSNVTVVWLDENIDTLLYGLTDNAKVYWTKTFAVSNSKTQQFKWFDFYGKEAYEKSLNTILNILTKNVLPFMDRFENDLSSLLVDASSEGFRPFDGKQFYDSGFDIPVKFIVDFGTKELLTQAFKTYYDNCELDFSNLFYEEFIEKNDLKINRNTRSIRKK